ncbi:phytoene desaturase family protein [Paenibacillus glycanilyticus]|uniref:phytoene desaturase family protein n=1 Tax=Paenibacillus glycanilyticus TaxID=126569 RepID=UPI003EBBFA12
MHTLADKRIAIIGAGPGGLAAAMLLSAAGFKVTIYEKQSYLGGRTSRLTLGDYHFDRGPTFFMMPQLLEELFAATGRSLHDYVKLLPLDPLYTLRFGSVEFSPSSNNEVTAERIKSRFPGNEDGFRRFLVDQQKQFDALEPLLKRPFSSVADYLSKDILNALPHLHPFQSVYDRLKLYFNDERLRYAFTFQSKYLGMSPWQCPGAFTMLSFLEHRFGLYHPVGGVNRVCEAMGEVVKENGGVIHLSTGVSRVLVKRGKAVGVKLDNGESVEADHVIINADFAAAMSSLFAPGDLRKYTPKKLERKRYSCSAFMLYMGVKKPVSMPHHAILFANDYRRNVDEMMGGSTLSNDPSVYVHNPSVLDSTLAPEGHSALYALMPVPNLKSGMDWGRIREEARDRMLGRLEKEPELRSLSASIEREAVITPLDWQDAHHIFAGATFNLAHTLDQMMLLRPRNRFEEIGNCWLVGGGTHPGSGLPTIFESARITSQLLLQDERAASIALSMNGASAGVARQGRVNL